MFNIFKSKKPKLQPKQLKRNQLDLILKELNLRVKLNMDRRENKKSNSERELIKLVARQKRNKDDEYFKAQEVVSSLNHIKACQIVMRYIQVLKDHEMDIVNSQGDATKICEVNKYIISVLWGGAKCNVENTNKLKQLMSWYFGPQSITQPLQNCQGLDPELQACFENLVPKTWEVNRYLWSFCQKGKLNIAKFNEIGHAVPVDPNYNPQHQPYEQNYCQYHPYNPQQPGNLLPMYNQSQGMGGQSNHSILPNNGNQGMPNSHMNNGNNGQMPNSHMNNGNNGQMPNSHMNNGNNGNGQMPNSGFNGNNQPSQPYQSGQIQPNNSGQMPQGSNQFNNQGQLASVNGFTGPNFQKPGSNPQIYKLPDQQLKNSQGLDDINKMMESLNHDDTPIKPYQPSNNNLNQNNEFQKFPESNNNFNQQQNSFQQPQVLDNFGQRMQRLRIGLAP